MQEFNFIDIVVGLLILLLGLKGLIRGIIKEVFGLISIVGGVYFASKYALDVGSYIDNNFAPIGKESVRSLVGFIALFVLIWAGVQMSGALLAKIIKASGLGFVDKIGGFVVGSAKVFLIFAIIAYGFGSVEFFQKAFKSRLEGSKLYPLLYTTGSYILNTKSLPKNVKEKVEQAKEKAQEMSQNISNAVEESIIKEVKKNIESNITKKVK